MRLVILVPDDCEIAATIDSLPRGASASAMGNELLTAALATDRGRAIVNTYLTKPRKRIASPAATATIARPPVVPPAPPPAPVVGWNDHGGAGDSDAEIRAALASERMAHDSPPAHSPQALAALSGFHKDS